MSGIELKRIQKLDEPQKKAFDNVGYILEKGQNGDAGGHIEAHNVDTKVPIQATNVNTDTTAINHVSSDADQPQASNQSGFFAKVQKIQDSAQDFTSKHSSTLRRIFIAILVLGYGAYFAYAVYHGGTKDEDSIRLIWVTIAVVVLVCISIVKDKFGSQIYDKTAVHVVNVVQKKYTIAKWLFILVVVGLIIAFIVVEVAIPRPRNMVSLSGVFVYLLIFFVFSTNPSKVRPRPVFWGLGLQFVLGVLILRTQVGFDAFNWMGTRMREFLTHSDAGARFVFGEKFTDHFFAMKVLPVVVFFSTVISVLYYLGAMQMVIQKVAWVLERTLGTTAGESCVAAGNIFLGQTESPLVVRPILPHMTPSELHAVMTAGFATIAGSVMATYILYGVPANHLLTASVMAAPCALGMSKLICPETETSQTTREDVAKMDPSPQRNIIEAASAGASASIKLVANIAVNLIAFLGLLAFVNATLAWLGARAGMSPPDYPQLTFQLICSYILWPFAFLMGVDSYDCRKVAELIGVKTFINEFVAYTELGKLIENRRIYLEYSNVFNSSYYEQKNDDIYLPGANITLYGGVPQQRTIVIATYALCGFANISSIGMVMGTLGALAPNKKSVIATLAVRAMITGNVVSWLNACTAGLLYQGT